MRTFAVVNLLLLFAWAVLSVRGQRGDSSQTRNADDRYKIYREENDIMWCCLSKAELEKCHAFAAAAEIDNLKSEFTFGSYYR